LLLEWRIYAAKKDDKLKERQEAKEEIIDDLKDLAGDEALEYLPNTNEGKRRNYILGIIDRESVKAFESKAFLRLPEDILRLLLSRDGLTANEDCIVEAVLRWLDANAKSMEKSKAIVPFFPLIRWPLISSRCMASVVAPSGVLAEDLQVELFKYIALRETKGPAPLSEKLEEKKMSTKTRVGSAVKLDQSSWNGVGSGEYQTYTAQSLAKATGSWNAGTHPTAWVQITPSKPTLVRLVKLTVNQSPTVGENYSCIFCKNRSF